LLASSGWASGWLTDDELCCAARGHSRSPRLPQCYMCFDDEDTTDNPLVAPCLCKGGTRYVHLECLQKWQAAAGEEKVRCAVLRLAHIRAHTHILVSASCLSSRREAMRVG
jgi:hypothetical protein